MFVEIGAEKRLKLSNRDTWLVVTGCYYLRSKVMLDCYVGEGLTNVCLVEKYILHWQKICK